MTTYLTPREIIIIGLIETGLSNQEIADYLNISYHTVKTHNEHIFEKLNVKNRVEAVCVFKKGT